ncbi:MAG TPA: hypothetical protein VH083_09555 [Myxococcales bacterium]|nr:hypothetical protein [Myxococcales bacterium]
MKKAAVFLIASIIGCGGTGDSGGGGSTTNAATGKTFNYGTPAAASGSQTQAVTRQFGSAGSITAASALGTVDVTSLTTAVLGSSASGFLRSPPEALTLGGASPALSQGCFTETGTTVTFTNCTIDASSGGTTVIETINGTLSATNSDSSWDLTYTVHESDSSFSIDESIRLSGSLHVTSSSIQGTMLLDGKVSATSLGSFEVVEAVILDLGYATPFCINSGTLEVKRVWVAKPANASGPAYADQGGKMTWTGCNQATLAHGT